MTLSPIRPGLTVRDSQILDLLLAGMPKTYITERGLYRRSWRAADVERVAAAQSITREEAGRWTPPELFPERRRVNVTQRQSEMLTAICEGQSIDTVARRFGIGAWTVKTHMKRLFKALGAKDRAHAAALVCSGQVAVVVGRAGRSQAGDTAVENANGSAA